MAHSEHRPAPSGTLGSRLRASLLFGLALLALLAVVHPDVMFGDRVYGSADASNSNAFHDVGNAWQQEHGDYPEWNPYLFAGMPTFGSAAYVRWVYPVSEVMNWLQNDLGFRPMTWMLAHLLFGGAGMIWLLGRWGLPPWARLLGAACWLLMPKVVAWGVHGHGSKLVTAMYMPWVLGWTLEALDGRARRAAGWLALLVGLMLLRAHPQISYYTFLAVGLVVVARWIAVAANRRRSDETLPLVPTLWGAAALIVGGLIAAVNLLPMQEYAPWSVRGMSEGGGAAYSFATGWSLSPRELGTFLFPSLAGFGQGSYLGPMPFNDYPNTLGFTVLVLAVAAWGDRRRWAVAALSAVFVVSVLVSFGKHLPVLYDPFFHLLPFFNKFRIPSMILVLAGFSAAVLAAVGGRRVVDLAHAGDGRARRLAFVLMGAGAVVLLGASGLARDLFGSQLESLAASSGRPAPPPAIVSLAWGLHQADLWRIGAVLMLFGGGLFAAVRTPGSSRRWLGWLLCLLVIVELGAVDRRITHPEDSLRRVARDASGRAALVASPALVQPWRPDAPNRGEAAYRRLAEALDHDRVWPLGRDAGLNDGMTAGVHSLGGYHPAKMAAFETIRGRLNNPEEPAGRVAAWLGARFVAFDQLLPEAAFPAFASLGTDLDPRHEVMGNLVVYRNRSALPRARLVHGWRAAAEDLDGFLSLIQDGRVDPGRQATLTAAPDPIPAPPSGAEVPVSYLLDGLDEVRLQASPTAPAILVLADMAYPGWRVEVDGEERTLLTVDHVLRGVALSAGDHEVRFVYHDPGLRRALILSIIGLVLASILLFVGIRESSTGSSAVPDAP